MGEGDKRRTRRAARFDSRELAVLSKKLSPTQSDWDEKVAAGSQKLPIADLASRTTTVDDPFTTSLLAEVARRSQTLDLAPDQIDEALDEALDEATDLEPGESDPADPS